MLLATKRETFLLLKFLPLVKLLSKDLLVLVVVVHVVVYYISYIYEICLVGHSLQIAKRPS